eukprot:TRINITY_DN773080_c0_g1_i1.p1 TRINITY_DN773080_c0_g1~~TRINITY_DN773080_c0_g1_i1.p1  ORF type:complete len:214 (-),score=36.83 TRINITY_DN773080_c0_g1_i1:142-783(-)
MSQRYYTPFEVSKHNEPKDCWVSIFGKVYNLTDLVDQHAGSMLPILKFAGEDITFMFDSESKEIKTHVDPKSQLEVVYLPHGAFLHAEPVGPNFELEAPKIQWWKDESLIVGDLTKKTREIRIKNTLTEQQITLEVCSEETMHGILNRLVSYNDHATSYTWKTLKGEEFVPLDMEKTLEENGIPDERDQYEELSLDDDFYIPVVHLYFQDPVF